MSKKIKVLVEEQKETESNLKITKKKYLTKRKIY